MKKIIDTNDAGFPFEVGCCYYRGYGNKISENYTEAFKWFMLAAEKGHALAQNVVGTMLSNGKGVEKDLEEGAKWYQRSAEQGCPEAQRNLALCYLNGYGVAKDYNKAFELFKQSPDVSSYWHLGDMCYEGKGTDRDLAQAKQYYEKVLFYQSFNSKSIKAKIENIDAELAAAEREARMALRKEVFVSYAHDDIVDIDCIKELDAHLDMLGKTARIEWWDDRQLKPGELWDDKIKEALAKAKVAVLLVSANFFKSKYVWNEELPKILAAAADEGLTVLWLPVSACHYQNTAIAKYQCVTDPKNCLAKLSLAERNEVYTALVERVIELV